MAENDQALRSLFLQRNEAQGSSPVVSKSYKGSKPDEFLEPYEYRMLDPETQEIRILLLLPGEFNSDIRIRLSHVPLVVPDEIFSKEISLEALERTLPPGWKAFETLDHRIIFLECRTGATVWIHPTPDIDPALYTRSTSDKYPGFQPQFEALSHTWGPEESPQTIFVEEVNGSKHAPVLNTTKVLKARTNLASALRHLRLPDKPRTLWVDALCINQNNYVERSEQVTRMADLY